jgi:hypothetical protein
MKQNIILIDIEFQLEGLVFHLPDRKNMSSKVLQLEMFEMQIPS